MFRLSAVFRRSVITTTAGSAATLTTTTTTTTAVAPSVPSPPTTIATTTENSTEVAPVAAASTSSSGTSGSTTSSSGSNHTNSANSARPFRTPAPTPSLRLTSSSHAVPSNFCNVGKLILLRNGQHSANADRSVYCTTPDWKIELTEKGKQQSKAAGIDIARRTNGDPVFVYFSPYLRSYQTMQAMLSSVRDERKHTCPRIVAEYEEKQLQQPQQGGGVGGSGPRPFGAASSSSSATAANTPSLNIIGVREDSRLRDVDIGRYEGGVAELDKCLVERQSYGSFFYRFPHGESGADVCDRVSSFLDAFQREQMHFPPKTNVVLVTHGLTIRLFVKRWFHLNVSTYHEMTSPPPGAGIELSYTCDDKGSYRFKLTEESTELLSLPSSLTDKNGYAFRHKRIFGSLSTGAPYV